MGKKFRALVVSGLLGSSLVSTVGVASVQAAELQYPEVDSEFQDCTSDSDQFCVERFEFTPTGETTQVIADAVVPRMSKYAGTDPNMSVYFRPGFAYTGPSSITAMNPESLNFTIRNPQGSMQPYPPNGSTIDGLKDGTYRFVARLGDFDPSFMLLTGNFVSYSVTKDASGYFKVDVTARPTPLAMVLAESQNSRIAIDRCEQNLWVTNCEANLASKAEIFGAFMMNPTADTRETSRGMWVAGNASTLQFSPIGLLTGSIDVTAKGPHYVPNDFPTSGLTKEGDRYLNPAHFEMGVPLALIAKILSSKIGMNITVDQVKTFLANPSAILAGTIQEVPAGASAAIAKAQTLTTTVGDTSLRVNFNLTHFSAPNPSLKISAPSTSGTGGTPSKSTSGSTTSKTLSNGAKLAIVKSASKGKTVTAKALLSPSTGATITKVVSKSTTVCTVSGTKVKMLKAGTCKLSATVKYKKKSTTAAVSFKVA